MTYFNYSRRKSSEVKIGNIPLGGDHPIRLQSMTNTSTMDTMGCVEQAKRIVEAGGVYVRLTTQGIKEAENLQNIHFSLKKDNYNVPLVADVHFNPKVADVAAVYVEKVRINPGNYVDPVKKFIEHTYTDKEYSLELQKIRERFVPFLNICRDNNTAIRIGVNHGSLSDRIMSRYRDTPEGMVESCMEFLRICVEENFMNVVVSIKASNTVVMVRTVRLLAKAMEEEGMAFPLHLGVTEAGDGEDGRIKSALGIGTLLADGLGDTIRVSLSEDPECEIPVAADIVNYINERIDHPFIEGIVAKEYDYYFPSRRTTHPVRNIGGANVPVVITALDEQITPKFTPDYIYSDYLPDVLEENTNYILPFTEWKKKENVFPVFDSTMLPELRDNEADLKFLVINYKDLDEEISEVLKENPEIVIWAITDSHNCVGEFRALVHTLMNKQITNPIVFYRHYHDHREDRVQVHAAMDMGPLIIDGFLDGIFLSHHDGNFFLRRNRDMESVIKSNLTSLAFGILQAGRVRTSKTEYISCPGCGRTLFDLQKTIARVKSATSHLAGLKIAIMGCIVNGPGEMVDADYGYVGAGAGKVSLYKKKECIERNIPEEEAVEKLIELIKLNGDF